MSGAGTIFRNGALLHERWHDLHDATLIGVFQYRQHATDLAKALARQKQDDTVAYVVTDLCDGSQVAFTRSFVDREASK